MANAFAPSPRMTAEAFVAWTETQPDRPRYELFDGHVYEMGAERLVHAEIKARIVSSFRRQIAERNLGARRSATAWRCASTKRRSSSLTPWSAADPGCPVIRRVIIDPVDRRRGRLALDSANRRAREASRYFRNPTLRHYLIIIPAKRIVLHHMRALDSRIATAAMKKARSCWTRQASNSPLRTCSPTICPPQADRTSTAAGVPLYPLCPLTTAPASGRSLSVSKTLSSVQAATR